MSPWNSNFGVDDFGNAISHLYLGRRLRSLYAVFGYWEPLYETLNQYQGV